MKLFKLGQAIVSTQEGILVVYLWLLAGTLAAFVARPSVVSFIPCLIVAFVLFAVLFFFLEIGFYSNRKKARRRALVERIKYTLPAR